MSARCRPRVHLAPAQAVDGRIVHSGIVSSCNQLPLTRDCKSLLVTSLTRVRSAIASTGPQPFHSMLYYSGVQPILGPNLQNFVKYTYENVTRALRIVS